MKDFLLVVGIVAAMAVAAYFIGAVAAVFAMIGRGLCHAFIYPIEARLLRVLQDRATARAFGTTVDVVRIRRKADTGDH